MIERKEDFLLSFLSSYKRLKTLYAVIAEIIIQSMSYVFLISTSNTLTMNGFEETVIIIFGMGLLGGLWIEAFYVTTIRKFLDILHLHLLTAHNAKTLEQITQKEQKKDSN